MISGTDLKDCVCPALDGGLVYDDCRVCDGDNSTCISLIVHSCRRLIGLSLIVYTYRRLIDLSLIAGDNSTCIGCDGVFALGLLERKRVDVCGVCGGDGLACLGCDGTPDSGLIFDGCRICGGDNSTCVSCDAVPDSGKVVDACGVCGGDGICRTSVTSAAPLSFEGGGVTASSIAATVAALLAVPASEVLIDITAIEQKIEQSLSLPGGAADYSNDAAKVVLRQGVADVGGGVGVDDVRILSVRHGDRRRQLSQKQKQIVGGGAVEMAVVTHRRALQDDTNAPAGVAAPAGGSTLPGTGTGVQVDYQVTASADISAAFTSDSFVSRFVAAVNALNSSALPVFNESTVGATAPVVETNVSFTVGIPTSRTAELAQARTVLQSDPDQLTDLAAAGLCSASPCQNGGGCAETAGVGFACTCAGRWLGEICTMEPPPPPPPPPPVAPGSVVATLSLEGDVFTVAGVAGSSERESFESLFKADVAAALSVGGDAVAASQVTITGIVAGSVVVTFAVSLSDEFCIKNEEFCIKNEEFLYQKRGILYSK